MQMLLYKSIAASCAIVVVILAWRVLNWAWLTPRKIEKRLRQQGFRGNPYKFLVGDLKESSMMLKETMSKPINISDDIVTRLLPHVVKTIEIYGKKSFTWLGQMPRVHIMEPNLVKEILGNYNVFHKNHHAGSPLTKFLLTGMGSLEGDKWVKRRRIVSPSFHVEKLKTMLPAFYLTYEKMLTKWEERCTNGSIEIDVFQTFEQFTSDVVWRVAFGSTYEEGERIFILIKELTDLTIDIMRSVYIPVWSDLMPTKRNRRIRAVDKEICDMLKALINSRVKAIKAGEPGGDDLLGTLLGENAGMSLEDVVSECKILSLVGQETTGILLSWTCVILSMHPHWQERAREEAFQVLGNANGNGNGKPSYERVQSLKIITMILYEVLRLYPPIIEITKVTNEEVKIGELTLPAGVQVMMPMLLLHRDKDMWGEDAEEFNPGRFAEGISKATKSPHFYIPFGAGPRVCVGQNFALLEAKLALAMILQRFSFQLSPSYTHAPFSLLTLQPQHGAPVIFHKLN